MNGVHDLGGMHGMGPVLPERDEPVFHHAWEARVFALTLATGFLGRWNLDLTRFTREQMPPAQYLDASYYERWLWGLERLLQEKGLLAGPAPQGARVLRGPDVARLMHSTRTARMDPEQQPRFAPGDAVRARNLHPTGHIRLPRYARGKRGVIHADHGTWVFPDSNAAEQGPEPQRCYSVAFRARELWGADAGEADLVHIDLFEPYLEPA
jgi:nitrile hydratase